MASATAASSPTLAITAPNSMIDSLLRVIIGKPSFPYPLFLVLLLKGRLPVHYHRRGQHRSQKAADQRARDGNGELSVRWTRKFGQVAKREFCS